MLVMNNQKCTVHIGAVTLLPGSNIVKNGGIDRTHPIVKALEENGKLSFEASVTPGIASIAISKANTRAVVEQIEKATKKPDAAVKKAAAVRKKELDDFDAEWEAAKKKKSEKGEANDTAANNG